MIEIPAVTVLCFVFVLFAWSSLVAGWAAYLAVETHRDSLCSCCAGVEERIEAIYYNTVSLARSWDAEHVLPRKVIKAAKKDPAQYLKTWLKLRGWE